MGTPTTDPPISKQQKQLYALAMVNAGIWVIAIIAWIVLFQGDGNVKGLFPILGGGNAVAIAMISSIAKLRS